MLAKHKKSNYITNLCMANHASILYLELTASNALNANLHHSIVMKIARIQMLKEIAIESKRIVMAATYNRSACNIHINILFSLGL